MMARSALKQTRSNELMRKMVVGTTSRGLSTKVQEQEDNLLPVRYCAFVVWDGGILYCLVGVEDLYVRILEVRTVLFVIIAIR